MGLDEFDPRTEKIALLLNKDTPEINCVVNFDVFEAFWLGEVEAEEVHLLKKIIIILKAFFQIWNDSVPFFEGVGV